MRLLVFILALLSPLPALALSCVAADVETSFARHDAAEETYVVVHGRLTFEQTALPKGMLPDKKPPELTRVPAHLRGSSLTEAGFVLPFDHDLTLEVACLGPWCGSAGNGRSVLAFVRKGAEGFAIEVSPCGGALFEEPKPAMLKEAKRCLTEGNCQADSQ